MTPARRVEQLVNKAVERVLDPLSVVQLINNNEHRAIVRLVKQQRDKLNPTIAVENWGKGYIEACDDLLAALTRRQKGTR